MTTATKPTPRSHARQSEGAANMHPLTVRINDVGRAEQLTIATSNIGHQEAENKYYPTHWAELYFNRNRFTIERHQTN
jgi:hypothetical protein